MKGYIANNGYPNDPNELHFSGSSKFTCSTGDHDVLFNASATQAGVETPPVSTLVDLNKEVQAMLATAHTEPMFMPLLNIGTGVIQ